jgi:hypothetical protein
MRRDSPNVQVPVQGTAKGKSTKKLFSELKVNS